EPISGRRAAEWGLVEEAVRPAEVFDTAAAIARTLAAQSPHSLAVIKALLRETSGAPLRDGLRTGTAAFARLRAHPDAPGGLPAAGHAGGPQGQNGGRTVAITSGLPSSVPGSTVSRFCASGLNAIAIAARMIEGGSYDVAIAGGLESITMLQNDHNRKNLQNPWLLDHKKDIYMPMGQTAEVVAERYGVTRDRQDEFALASQQRTAAAQRAAKFADEILPMTVTMQVTDKVTGATSTKEATVDRDECNRPDTTLEGLA